MAARRVVVDGSNIATEGRTLPSLKQLNEAVLAFITEYPDTEVTVVVDATFGHRIDPTEVAEFEEAEANNEVVSPPAGAIGRGDAFLLRIAGKIGATVLSNDSFQEFHGEHEWLFEDGRLIGGKPVQGIGWIFTPRTPVRGVKSRKAVKDAKKTKGPALAVAPTMSGESLGPRPVPKAPPPRRKEKGDGDGGKPGKSDHRDAARVADAIATATAESVVGNGGGRKRRRKKRGGRPAEPVNEALPFISFIAEHPLGSQVDGEVETFTSHGAFVLAEGARCYVPISALGDPPPRAARDVLNRGERRVFVVQALDPQRRGIELALPEFARVAGSPLPETIEAEITEAPAPVEGAGARRRKAAPAARRAAARTEPVPVAVDAEAGILPEAAPVPSGRGRKRAAAPVDAEVPAEAAPAVPEVPAVAETSRGGRKKAGAQVAAAVPDGPVMTEQPSVGRGRRPGTGVTPALPEEVEAASSRTAARRNPAKGTAVAKKAAKAPAKAAKAPAQPAEGAKAPAKVVKAPAQPAEGAERAKAVKVVKAPAKAATAPGAAAKGTTAAKKAAKKAATATKAPAKAATAATKAVNATKAPGKATKAAARSTKRTARTTKQSD